MARHVEVFWGPKRESLDTAVRILGRLSGVVLEPVYVAGFLQDKVQLPFIEVDRGARYYGLPSIIKYVEEAEAREKAIA